MDNNIRAIIEFMRLFVEREGLDFSTKAIVKKMYSDDIIFDDMVKCYISNNIPSDRYDVSIEWNGIKDNTMRALGMKGIYASTKHDFVLEDDYLEISDYDNERIIQLKSR